MGIIIVLGIAALYILIVAFIVIKTLPLIDNYSTKQTPNTIGNEGENLIYETLKKIENESHILRNIYVKKQNGEYTEIDLITINTKGIFVIESKNFSGWIFGDEKQENWTQTFQTGEKFKFYNPVWQNKTHIKALRSLLKHYPTANYFSIIVFSERCEIKHIKLENEANTFVIKRDNLYKLLETIKTDRKDTLTETEIEEISEKLRNMQTDQNIKSTHIQSVEENKKICPLCKKNLIKRTNKKNNKSFYGCSGYPNCKYTRNI